MTRHFEDIEHGESREFGERRLTADEITAFAERYDPQPFHIDETAAEASMYDGLIASGWQTAAIWMRMAVDHLFSDWAAMGSPGVDELRWRRPVRPGETVSARTEVVGKERSAPTYGMIDIDSELVTTGSETAMTMTARVMVGCRDEGRSDDR